MTNARRLGGLALLVGTLLLVAPIWASAHSLVQSSDPANGAILSRAPRDVIITFTEAPDPDLSVIHVLDSSGRAIEAGEAQAVPGNQLQLEVPLGALPNGAYTVSWRAVSRVDGHVASGAFTFGIGAAPGPPSTGGGTATGGGGSGSSAFPSPLAVAGRWGLYWGLAILLGAGVIGTFVVRAFPGGGRAVLVGAWVLAAVGLVAIALAERSAIGVSMGTLLRSQAGGDLVGQAVTLAIALGTVLVVVAQPRWISMPFLAGGAAIAMYVHALSGHADGESPVWFNVGVQWVHLVSIGIWIGGLAWLLLCISGTERPDRAVAIRRFSGLALYALAATIATGVIRAIAEVGSVGALFDTSFGITLLVKVALVAVLIALGGLNRYRNVPAAVGPDGRVEPLRRTIRWELIVAAAVLAAAAVLSGLPPSASTAAASREPAPASAQAPALVIRGNDFATSVRVTLSITPGTVGPNAFVARVVDYDTGQPVDAQRVSLGFSLPSRPDVGSSTLELKDAGGGRWTAQGTALAIDGRWAVTVTIQQATGGVQVPLTVVPRLPPEQITVSRQAGQPTLYTVQLTTGGSMQGYVDPGSVGTNQVHFTFFTADGNEQPIDTATAAAVPPSGDPRDLPLTRFSAGHFVANADLAAGVWRFAVQATLADGTVLLAYFTPAVDEGGS